MDALMQNTLGNRSRLNRMEVPSHVAPRLIRARHARTSSSFFWQPLLNLSQKTIELNKSFVESIWHAVLSIALGHMRSGCTRSSKNDRGRPAREVPLRLGSACRHRLLPVCRPPPARQAPPERSDRHRAPCRWWPRPLPNRLTGNAFFEASRRCTGGRPSAQPWGFVHGPIEDALRAADTLQMVSR
jgi:hypothetical protein